jgi:aerobic-type carbon monoxide dehydrogenase small subunit (CoxS/CutS family)
MPSILLTVDGKQRRVDAPSDETLLVVLRDRLDLTGTKCGCGEGQCRLWPVRSRAPVRRMTIVV